ncbi:hypothetical protein LY78DRAFT_121890 [Colletotrichum sublineola]|nr:hypothetical protein LY78DRAFT_121890 [Colletotrichum sublineola]
MSADGYVHTFPPLQVSGISLMSGVSLNGPQIAPVLPHSACRPGTLLGYPSSLPFRSPPSAKSLFLPSACLRCAATGAAVLLQGFPVCWNARAKGAVTDSTVGQLEYRAVSIVCSVCLSLSLSLSLFFAVSVFSEQLDGANDVDTTEPRNRPPASSASSVHLLDTHAHTAAASLPPLENAGHPTVADHLPSRAPTSGPFIFPSPRLTFAVLPCFSDQNSAFFRFSRSFVVALSFNPLTSVPPSTIHTCTVPNHHTR